MHRLSFTGHSLGGGLAGYLVYKTKGTTSTTFNAVGFAQCLTIKELESILDNHVSYRERIKDYCDAWDMIGNSGIHIGERIFLINDQILKGPIFVAATNTATNPWDYLNNYLTVHFKNIWDYAVYKCENNIDKAKDFIKCLLNSYIPVTGLVMGYGYSHGLKHFLNDINADESLIKSNIAGSSEVQYYQDISKILYIKNNLGFLGLKRKERTSLGNIYSLKIKIEDDSTDIFLSNVDHAGQPLGQYFK